MFRRETLCDSLSLVALALAGAGCGDRSPIPLAEEVVAVPVDGGHDGAGPAESGAPPDVGRPDACGASDPVVPIDLGQPLLQQPGNVAAATCSFAVTWIENRSGRLAVAARTIRVVGGAWTSSATITVAGPPELTVNVGNSHVGWDGAAYVVAWTDRGAVHFRRFGEDGALLGAPVSSASIGTDSYVVWMSPAPDGTMRVGLLDDRTERYHYQVYFLRIAPDGTAPVPAVRVTPGAAFAEPIGMTHRSGNDDVVFWTDGADPLSMPVFATSFDDLGQVGETLKVVRSVDGVSSSGDGVVFDGASTYFGISEGVAGHLLFGRLDMAGPGYTTIPGLPGRDVPALAVTAGGTIGVLAGSRRSFDGRTKLEVAFVLGGHVTSTRPLAPATDAAPSYGLAATPSSFGAWWTTTGGLRFTVVTP